MKPKPPFSVIKNLKYALCGTAEVFRNEKAFAVECIVFIAGAVLALLLELSWTQRAVLVLSLLFVLIVELLNSAVERAVDTATLQYNETAKRAKDAGAAAVLFSIVFALIIWAATLYDAFCA